MPAVGRLRMRRERVQASMGLCSAIEAPPIVPAPEEIFRSPLNAVLTPRRRCCGTDRGLSVRAVCGEAMGRSYGADHWRKLAKDARTAAGAMTNPTAKRELTEIAEAYERLADRAVRAARRKGSRTRTRR
jgi:hypothetical protein